MVQSRAPEIGISLKIQYFHPYPNCQNGGEMGLCGVYCTVLKLIIILLQELLALCINNNIIISIITPLRLRGKYLYFYGNWGNGTLWCMLYHDKTSLTTRTSYIIYK